MKFRAFFSRLMAALPNLKRLTASVLGGTWDLTLPCAARRLIMYLLDTVCAANDSGAQMLVGLLMSIIVLPVAAGMITYAAGASWEGRRATIVDAYHLARIRIKEIVITGLAAGAIVLIANWLASFVYSLIGIVSALLGWLPVIGPVITAAVSAVFWLISLAMEFFAHIALVIGMLSLTADGVTGRAQAERALSILRSGGEELLCELGLVFLMWIAVQGVYELAFLFAPLSGALVCDALLAALTAVSMVAVSVIYLRARDRQDGMRYHA